MKNKLSGRATFTGIVVASLLPAVAYGAFGFGAADDHVYTLYRGSPLGSDVRVHVATFDADEKGDYNRENCDTARRLFQSQPGVRVRYWCERGFYSE